ncbi:MAG TPA: hypothetical protein VL282_17345, partial [Tepidisphaeraceae bacterium]|nr:hypothetical protein [Tepidisphaeraceae bacterium]
MLFRFRSFGFELAKAWAHCCKLISFFDFRETSATFDGILFCRYKQFIVEARPTFLVEGEFVNTEDNGISRRDLGKRIGQIAAVSALAGVAIPSVYAAENSTIQIALIGCGGRGTGAA